MGTPAVVMNDQVVGICPLHQIPSPVGAPMPGPPMPFSAPLTVGLAMTVLIGGQLAAVAGSSGFNSPPHVGLHASDPFMLPPMQEGKVLTGSATVLFEGKPAATSTSACTMCMGTAAQVAGTAASVLVGE